MPIFQYMRVEGDLSSLAAEGGVWSYALKFFDEIHIELTLGSLLLLALVFFLCRQVFMYLQFVYRASVIQKLNKVKRDELFRSYLEARTDYHDELRVGGLVNIMTTEVEAAVESVMAPLELLAFVALTAGYVLVLSFLSWQVTLVAVLILLIAIQAPKIWVQMSTHAGRKLVTANTSMTSFLLDRLKSPRLVRLAGTEEAENKEFSLLTQLQRKHAMQIKILIAKIQVALEPIIIGMSLVFLYFSYNYLKMPIEVMGLYLLIMFRISPLVKAIIAQWQLIQRQLGSVEAVEDRKQRMNLMKEDNSGTKILDGVNDGIEYVDVSYHYPNAIKNALNNISIFIPANQVTALVGPSGGGKSTFIDLLPRLRIPSLGTILIDGVRVDEYRLDTLRYRISYVPQSPQIFDGSVANHIQYGKPGASIDEIREAADLAGASEFIDMLPEGYDTPLGEDAVKLSGGQRQRLDLARDLIRKAPILILDEPTSNLDAESEDKFRDTLAKIKKKKTTTIIIISHQLPSICDADQIITLKEGMVEGVGSHAELMNVSKWYSEAWKIQENKK